MLGLRFCARAFSSCGERGPPFIVVRGPLTVTASRCGAQAPDVQAQQLWLTGLVAPRHVGSSQTRARTRVPCIGRQILNHCATREALHLIFDSLINRCLGVFLLGFILYGTLCASCTSLIISFPILGKLTTIISSRMFSQSLFFSLLLLGPL